jgi:hypothetical protein
MSEMGPPRLLGEHTSRNVNAGTGQDLGGAPASAGIGIVNGIDHAANPGRANRIGARRRLPMMTARLQTHVKSRAPRLRTRLAQGFGLRMRAAAGVGPAARQNGAVLNKQRANGGIWRAKTKPAPAK